MGGAFYNERDPFAAQWLRNLIAAGLIPDGLVDERDIRDIRPTELAGFRQCHFFAGIGVWALALRRAGWADDRPVWTGSCPCQPFSSAGKREGVADERHLWPAFFHLIEQCGPDAILGEQVASKDGLGWLDLVSADLEGAGYAFSAGDLCAAGFSGAHIRQRLYFVGLADAVARGWARQSGSGGAQEQRIAELRGVGGVADAQHDEQWRGRGSGCEGAPRPQPGTEPSGCGSVGRLADAGLHESQRRKQPAQGFLRSSRNEPSPYGDHYRTHAPLLGRDAADWLFCRDGKWRPVEPGTFPLADATPGRVGRLRAYGNALDLGTATGFVEAVIAAIEDVAPAMERAA